MQIRVRAWHKTQKKMYYPEELGADQLTLMPDGRGFVNVSGSDTRLSLIDDNRTMAPLMSTGLRDKNGKEIYEGDVIRGNLIKYSPLLTRGEVVFDEHWASFAYMNLAGKTLLREIDQIEVIGNRFENPDELPGISG